MITLEVSMVLHYTVQYRDPDYWESQWFPCAKLGSELTGIRETVVQLCSTSVCL